MLSAGKRNRNRGLSAPRQRVLPTRVEIDVKGIAGKSCASATRRLREQTRVCCTASGAAGARCLTSPPLAGCLCPHPPQPTGTFYKLIDWSVSDRSQHKPATDRPEQTPLQRKPLAFVSTSPFAKTQVGSYFHTTFVRSEVNRLHHSYLNLQKELVGSGQRVKNALMYLGALLYATSTATRLCWKG